MARAQELAVLLICLANLCGCEGGVQDVAALAGGRRRAPRAAYSSWEELVAELERNGAGAGADAIGTNPLSLPIGATCMVDGYPGTCRYWKHCFRLVYDLGAYWLGGIREKLPPLCSHSSAGPIVCCTSCKLVDDVSKLVINPMGGLLTKTNQKSWNQCINYFVELPYDLKYSSTLIDVWKMWNENQNCFEIDESILMESVGGRAASRAEFPHMALLGYGNANETNQWVCGGTIISDRFILTAGHCIFWPPLGEVTYAALGILKRSDPENLWQKYRIESIIPHPMYRSPSKYHDIALLKTMQRVIFNKNAMPTCLPNLAEKAYDEEAQATGWGTTGPRTQLADTLQAVKVAKFSAETCSELFGRNRHLASGYNNRTQMCYGDPIQIRDTCKGDSGGPLQIRGQVYYWQWTVIGVTSLGRECGHPGQAGIYTRVAPYVPWIESVVWG